MEPSSVNESFHTARSTITSSPSDSNSHSTLHSSSIASTIKPDLRQQQSDMSRNIPSPQSEEPASSRREGLEPRNRVQFFGEAEEANDTTSQITTDTAQPDVTSTVQERDIVFCAIIESKDFTHGPKLQKANKTRKSAQVVEWKEMEVVFTSNELLFNTMSRIFPGKRYLALRIKMSSVTQYRLASPLEYIIELTAKTSAGGGVRIAIRPKTSKAARNWYMLLYAAVPQASKSSLPTIIEIDVPEIETQFQVPISTPLSLTYAQLKQMIIDSMMEEENYQGVYKKWHQHQQIGLCWRYQDRLEWCVDENEQVLGPQLTEGLHKLELRKIEHMPTSLTVDGRDLAEPEAIEGILTRLTNRKGQLIKNQKFSQRRFFFSTHYQYLVNLPANTHCAGEERIRSALGMIDLCEVEVIKVWKTDTQYGNTAVQSTASMISHSSSTPIIETARRNGVQQEPRLCWCCFPSPNGLHKDIKELEKRKKCFEIVLKNGLSIIYQAASVEDRENWIQRLQDLSLYWKSFKQKMIYEQVSMQKTQIVRTKRVSRSKTANGIDVEYDVASSQDTSSEQHEVANPVTWNYCIPACCRQIMISGPLYYRSHFRKPFKQDIFILTRDCQLVQFNSYERNKLSGQIIPSVYHAQKQTFDVSGSYVYTDNDNETSPRRPSRMYPDGLVVPKDEEENACAFSIWFPLTRKYFSNKSQKVVVTKQHTLRGKSWLFMTRTRQEKDLWVMAINAVLDRQEQ